VLCSKAVQQLVDDEDDLFFESGRHMPELLAALVSRTGAFLKCCGHMVCWQAPTACEASQAVVTSCWLGTTACQTKLQAEQLGMVGCTLGISLL
jgi:hypothetical protein